MESRRRRPLRLGQWLQIILAGLVVAAAAYGYASTQSPTYQSDMKFFVSAAGDSDPSTSAQAGSFAQQRIKSYPNVVGSGQVTAPVIAALHLDLTPAELQKKITAQVPLDTVVLEVSVTDSSAREAQRIAAGIQDVLPGVLERLEGAKASAKSATIVVSTLQPPNLPTSPTSPNKMQDAILGLIVGLALGLGWVLLRTSRDQAIRSAVDAQVAANAPVLIEVPSGRSPRATTLEGSGAGSARAEAYRQLRTSVQVRLKPGHSSVVVVASARAREGRSVTAANLAMAMALAGRRVILIDGDLRTPTLSATFGYTSSAGLADILLGKGRIEDALQVYRPETRLRILPAGVPVNNPSELLSSPSMAALLHAARSLADIVIVDTAPLLSVTDAAILTTISDAAILVVRHGKTIAEDVSQAAARLSEVDVDIQGVVLNHTPKRVVRGGPKLRRRLKTNPAVKPALIGSPLPADG